MAQLPTISYASSIVGFLSFAFTFFTFVRVFWETILTLWHAPQEMRLLLDSTRSELRGERAYYRAALRRRRSGSQSKNPRGMYDDLEVIKLLNGTTRNLLSQFEELERPFLEKPPEYDEKDLERSDDSRRIEYAPMELNRRWGTHSLRSVHSSLTFTRLFRCCLVKARSKMHLLIQT